MNFPEEIKWFQWLEWIAEKRTMMSFIIVEKLLLGTSYILTCSKDSETGSHPPWRSNILNEI